MIRKLYRRSVPAPVRRALRAAYGIGRNVLRDGIPDLLERLRPAGREPPLPPAGLRRRVSMTGSRREFLEVGASSARDVLGVFAAARDASSAYPRWLDFGCGPGRVARHLARADGIEELWGLDVDGDAIAWASRHLPGQYLRIQPDPPTPSPPNHFDVVYACSVFTHLNEDRQIAWLHELHRALRPGGLMIASTHSPALSFIRPDLSERERQELLRPGFLFAPGGGGFSEDSAFHSREYLLETWGRLFGLVHFREHGLAGYQDLTVWKKW